LAHRRDLYLTTDNIHKRKTAMPPAGFESAIPASERLQAYAIDRAVTEILATVYGINYGDMTGVQTINLRKYDLNA
jgi:hypothetical protein